MQTSDPIREMTATRDRFASARATADELARKAQQRAERPPAVTRRLEIPVALPPPAPRRPPIALAATAVIIAVIGAGAYEYRAQKESALAHENRLAMAAAAPAPIDVVEPATPAPAPPPNERPVALTPAPRDVDSTTVKSHPPAAPKAADDRPAPTKPTTGPRNATASARPSRATTTAPVKSNRAQGPLVEKQAVAVLTAAPVIAKPAVNINAAAPKPAEAAPIAAVGPFFETRDVNEQPRIETRARPRLPAELKNRPLNEVVVVRALVSQSGRPSRISLLRRSKIGPELDDIVVEAVNRWTFAPAKKKGEAVSCWFNFAVQVGGNE
jgi:TonB family protein